MSPERIQEDFDALSFDLTSEQFEKLSSLQHQVNLATHAGHQSNRLFVLIAGLAGPLCGRHLHAQPRAWALQASHVVRLAVQLCVLL